MGCIGYRDRPCDCETSLIEYYNYILNDGETGYKELICDRCYCRTGEIVYVNVDKDLLGPKRALGVHGTNGPA